MRKLIWLLLATTALAQTHTTVTIEDTQTITGNKTFTGTVNTTLQNNVYKCDQYAGATFDVKVNACITAVISAGGGIADARGLVGAQTGTVEIDVGTRTTSGVTGNSISVTLLLSPYLVYTTSLNTAGACGIKVFNESHLIGNVSGTSHSAIIKAGSSVSAGSLVCNDYTLGSGIYTDIQGLQVYNQGSSGSTYTNGAVYIKNAYDTSSVSNMIIANEGGIGLHVQATCCQTVFRNIISDGNSTTGSIPVQIDSLQGDLQPVLATQFVGLSADHPGATKNNIVITHTFTSTTAPCVIAFVGIYMEGNASSDTTTPLMLDAGCTLVNAANVTAQLRVAASTAHAISITQPGAVIPIFNLQGGAWQNSGLTYPAGFLDDNYRGATAVSDGDGIVTSYEGGDTLSLAQQLQLYGYLQYVETAVPSAIASRALCYADSTSHTIKCSYNNGAFLTTPQIITTTLTTTAATTDNVTVTGMVSTGHCGLTPTNSGAAGGIASVFISNKTTNQITVTHTATSGWTFDVMCFPQ